MRAADALARAVMAELRERLAVSVCAFVPVTTARFDDALAHRPDAASEAVADYRDKLKTVGPRLQDACLAKTREALAAPAGPLAAIGAELPKRLAERLTRDELEQSRAAVETPAARKLTGFRRDLEQRAATELGPWADRFLPAMNEELRLSLQGEIGAVPALHTPVLPPLSEQAAAAQPARITNLNTLPELCSSFYPVASRRASEEGSVVLAVHVTASGRVDGIEIERSSGAPALDVAAAGCIAGYGSFAPRREGDQAVPGWQRLKWTWRLTD